MEKSDKKKPGKTGGKKEIEESKSFKKAAAVPAEVKATKKDASTVKPVPPIGKSTKKGKQDDKEDEDVVDQFNSRITLKKMVMSICLLS